MGVRPISARDPYLHAAAGYAAYGVVYLVAAAAELRPEMRRDWFGFVPWWAFFLLGGVLILIVPLAILRWRPWVARIMALGPLAKALVLCFRLGTGRVSGAGFALTAAFAAVAIIATVLLLRAGFGPREARQ